MSCYWERDSLSLVTNVVTILGIAGSPLYYFIKKHLESRSDKRRALESIFNELDDGELALTKDHHRRVTKEYNGRKYEFVAAFLNHDVYDSLIYSGRINHLDVKIQQTIQDVFAKIKDRNSYVKKIIELEESVNVGKATYEGVSMPASRYCDLVVKYEGEIKDVISEFKGEKRSVSAHSP